MIIETQRFIEFGADYFQNDPRRKEDLVWEPVTINTDYIACVYRMDIGPFEACLVHMVDRGCNFRVDATYEQAKVWMRSRREAA